MNQYGRLAWDHWARWRPTAVSRIPDPESFFAQLGNVVADQIHATARSIAGEDPPGESYSQKLGRLGQARFTAEETVLRERVLLPPEPGHPETDLQQPTYCDPASLPTEQSWSEAEDIDRPQEAPWLPVVMSPDHPNFHDTDEDPLLRRIPSSTPVPAPQPPESTAPHPGSPLNDPEA